MSGSKKQKPAHDLAALAQISKTAHAAPARSLAKAISWRVLGSIDTFVVAYVTTGQAKIGFTIASVEVLTKLALYYLHERGWAHIRWGLK